MESKANRGAAAAASASARSLLGFSLDANQRLDLGAGQASGTSLCLADPGNLLSIIPPPRHSAPLGTRQPISPNLHGKAQERLPWSTRLPRQGNNHIMAVELLHAPYYPSSLCGSNLGIP